MIIKNNKGFSLPELAIVISVMMVLMVVGTKYIGSAVNSTRISTCENDLRVAASDLEVSLNEIGKANYRELEAEKEIDVKEYLKKLQKMYLHTEFDLDTLVLTTNGFRVTTTLQDPWQLPYLLDYKYTEEYGSVYSIISGGNNGIYEADKVNTLEEKALSRFDDVVCIIRVKENNLDRVVSFD